MSKTPSEIEALAEIERQKAAGHDPFGDDELDLDVKKEPAVEDEPDLDPENPDADVTTQDAEKEGGIENADEQVLQEVIEEDQEQPLTTYKAEVSSDYKTQRTELLKGKADAMKKLMDGEIDSDAYAAEDLRISDALEELTAQRIRAETLIEANQQAAAQMQQREIQKLITRTKSQIDYLADTKAQRQFDVAMQAIGADPDNAGKDYAELITEAHKVVLALRGVSTAKPKDPEPRQPQIKPPVTLRGLPTASTPNSNGDVLEQMSRLTGQAYQEAFNKLSPQQRKALLDEE